MSGDFLAGDNLVSIVQTPEGANVRAKVGKETYRTCLKKTASEAISKRRNRNKRRQKRNTNPRNIHKNPQKKKTTKNKTENKPSTNSQFNPRIREGSVTIEHQRKIPHIKHSNQNYKTIIEKENKTLNATGLSRRGSSSSLV
jgi:hypothetical protein